MTSRTDIELVTDKPKSRQCGSCSACCRGWLDTEVLGEKLTVGKPCRHVVKQGCSIHETRPQFPCRDFVCGWLFEESPLPDWMRPNHCGAIVFPWYEWRYFTVVNAVAVGDKIPKRTLN